MSGYRPVRYPDAQQLVTLRRAAHVTQQQMANLFDVRDLATVRDWENGLSKPHSKHRSAFISYLWATLALRRDPEEFNRLWDEIMVDEWGWNQLSEADLQRYSPTLAKQLISFVASTAIHMEPPRLEYELFGRGKILQSLKRQLQQGKSVALYGQPGAGKTTLAIQLANDPDIQAHYPDGILWATLSRSGGVLDEFGKWGAKLGIARDAIADPKSIHAWAGAIHDAIKEKRLLLVIDNAWHVEDAMDLRIGDTHCVHLLTTRFPAIASRFAGHGAVNIQELSDRDSRRILKDLIPEIVRDEPDRIDEIIRYIGGLPLAIRIIGKYLQEQATRGQQTPVLAALERLKSVKERLLLGDYLSPLDRNPDLPEHTPMSLQLSILISDEILDEDARYTLRTLAPFPPKPNTFSQEAAAACSKRVQEAVHRLYGHGLLESYGGGRYAVHQTIADYATVNLTDDEVYRRFITYFVAYVEEHENDYLDLERDFDNVNAALQIALDRKSEAYLLRGVNAFFQYLDTRGFYTQARTYLQQAEWIVRHASDLPAFEIFRTFSHWTVTHYHLSNYDSAEAYCNEALDLARQIDDEKSQSAFLQFLALIAEDRGDLKRAEELYRRAIIAAQAVDDRRRLCGLLLNLGVISDEYGKYEESRGLYEQSLALARELADDLLVSMALMNLGAVALDLGDYTHAEQYSGEGYELSKRIKYNTGMTVSLTRIGQSAVIRGDWEQARRSYEEAWERNAESGIVEDKLHLYSKIAYLEIELQDYAKAQEHLLAGVELAREKGHKERLCVLLTDLGYCALMQSDYSEAQRYLQEAQNLIGEESRRGPVSTLHNHWGEFYLRQKRPDLALKHFETAHQVAAGKAGEGLLKEQAALALFGLAQATAAQAEWEEADRRGHASLALFKAMGHHGQDEVRQWLLRLPEAKHLPG